MLPEVLERYARGLQRVDARERAERHEQSSRLAAASEERAPGWLRLTGVLTVVALDAIAAGSNPAQALSEAVARSDADADDVERALEQLRIITEMAEREEKRAAPVQTRSRSRPKSPLEQKAKRSRAAADEDEFLASLAEFRQAMEAMPVADLGALRTKCAAEAADRQHTDELRAYAHAYVTLCDAVLAGDVTDELLEAVADAKARLRDRRPGRPLSRSRIPHRIKRMPGTASRRRSKSD
jgi:hypothetical protein